MALAKLCMMKRKQRTENSGRNLSFCEKIHNIVHDKLAEGLGIIIVGDGTHPEVIGINGWCENAAVILEDEEAAKTKEIPEKEKIRRCGADHIPSGKIRQDSGNFAGQRCKYGSP